MSGNDAPLRNGLAVGVTALRAAPPAGYQIVVSIVRVGAAATPMLGYAGGSRLLPTKVGVPTPPASPRLGFATRAVCPAVGAATKPITTATTTNAPRRTVRFCRKRRRGRGQAPPSPTHAEESLAFHHARAAPQRG